MTPEAPIPPEPSAKPPRFFQRVDWLAFGVTAFSALLVYWLTLAPEATLAKASIYIASAVYPGPSVPPGHPLWVTYAWLFTELIPFSNVAWRVNLSSAVAGALTCGLIALLVSRVGFFGVRNLATAKNLSAREQSSLRLICGLVAGLGFGFDGCLWPRAVIADPWPLSLLLIAVSLCLLTRFFFLPGCRYPLYVVFFISALALVESQILAPILLSLILLIVLSDHKVGRDILVCTGICFWLTLSPLREKIYFLLDYDYWEYDNLIFWGAILISVIGGILIFITRRVFTEWRVVIGGGLCFLTGLGSCLLLPLFSMTNPPVNWDYKRTVLGFLHINNRGQYGYFGPGWPGFNLHSQIVEWEVYLKNSVDNFGLPYLIAPLIALLLIKKFDSATRKWLISVIVMFLLSNSLILAFLVAAVYERDILYGNELFFAASHLLLAILAGMGFMVLAVILTKPAMSKNNESTEYKTAGSLNESTL